MVSCAHEAAPASFLCCLRIESRLFNELKFVKLLHRLPNLTTLKLVDIEDVSSNFLKVSFNICSQDSVPYLSYFIGIVDNESITAMGVSQLANAQSWGVHYRLGSFMDPRRVTFARTSTSISKTTSQPTSAHANQFSPSDWLGSTIQSQVVWYWIQLVLVDMSVLNVCSTTSSYKLQCVL